MAIGRGKTRKHPSARSTKTKVPVTSNSMLTCILRKGLNKKHNSVVKSFYADTCEKVLEVL